MKNRVTIIVCTCVFLSLFCLSATGMAEELPVKGMPTMIDLGAGKCIPCKLMAPIIEKLEVEYEGKAAIAFIDVWKSPWEAEDYGISTIPTQIFYDKKGQEHSRHVGFLEEKEIRSKLDMLIAQ